MSREALSRLHVRHRSYCLERLGLLRLGFQASSNLGLQFIKITSGMQVVRNDVSVPDIERKWIRPRIKTNQDYRFVIGKSKSNFIPNVRVVGCDIGETNLRFSNAFFNIINQDGG